MISLWFTIKAAIALLSKFILFIGAGAAVGAVATFTRPVWGVIGNAIMGATVVGLIVLSGWASDDRGYIKRLKEQNEILTKKNLELKRTGAAQAELIGELGKASTHNEEVLDRLRDKMDSIPDCEIPEGVIDELRQIR